MSKQRKKNGAVRSDLVSDSKAVWETTAKIKKDELGQ